MTGIAHSINQRVPLTARSLKCMIIDDEEIFSQLIGTYIKKTPFLSMEGAFNNPFEALTALSANNDIDLIFLDVLMPGLNGIELAKAINVKSKIIFISSMSDYAIDGFELNAVDYLLKPVPYDRFLKAVQKVLDATANHSNNAVVPTTYEDSQEPDILFVRCEGKIVKVNISEILFIEAKKEYISICTANNKLMTLQSLHHMEKVLMNKKFIRVHKSFIVALDKIDVIERNRIIIKQNYIPIGESYRGHFFELVNQMNISQGN